MDGPGHEEALSGGVGTRGNYVISIPLDGMSGGMGVPS